MENWSIWLTLLVIVLAFSYSKYVELSTDVNHLYLNSQSSINSTRLPKQSPIYKSSQLSYTGNLRSGLDIRYDSYKLRNGNLKDVWEFAMIHNRKSQNDKSMVFDNYEIKFGELNYFLKTVSVFLKKENINEIAICCSIFSSLEILILALSCFASGVSVHFFNSVPQEKNDIDLIVLNQGQLRSLSETVGIENIVIIDSTDVGSRCDSRAGVKYFDMEDLIDLKERAENDGFENVYTKINDAGAPFKQTINFRKVEYTHLNFVSAISSTIKHLPMTAELGKNDTLLVIVDGQKTNLSYSTDLSQLIKILAGFVVGLQVNIQTKVRPETFKACVQDSGASVLSINERQIRELLPLPETCHAVSWIKRLWLQRDASLLSLGVFSTRSKLACFSNVRLTYCYNMFNDASTLTSEHFNVYRCLTGSRVVVESMFSGILGTLALTNYYDYRVIDESAVKFRGGISQSLEVKLVNHDIGDNADDDGMTGEVYVRGYTIGKQDANRVAQLGGTGNGDGFMPTRVTGQWGEDGCLYVNV